MSGITTVDLSKGNTFELTTSAEVTQFNLINSNVTDSYPLIADSGTTFTLKILQGSTAYAVDVDTFKNVAGVGLTVYWPGGVTPTVTETAAKTDIYSFMTFDGGNTLYGVVGGQNFS